VIGCKKYNDCEAIIIYLHLNIYTRSLLAQSSCKANTRGCMSFCKLVISSDVDDNFN